MFQRNALTNLKLWASTPNHKPLVLRGARQVGKTTLVNQFAEEYGVYLKLNLEKDTDRQLFEDNISMEERITAIYLLNNQEKKRTDTSIYRRNTEFS